MSVGEKIEIPCRDIRLEGILELPQAKTGVCPVALSLHPHPLYGGNMFNNVSSKLASGLVKHGIATLRFNFRGVGGSEGAYGEGASEVEDVLAALDFIDQRQGLDSSNLVLAGYSFGCWVGLKAAVGEKRPMRLIGVSPPVDMYDFGFLNSETRPKLLIAGDRDFVCSKAKFLKLAETIPEPKKIVVLNGIDHFHSGSEDRVVEIVLDFLGI